MGPRTRKEYSVPSSSNRYTDKDVSLLYTGRLTDRHSLLALREMSGLPYVDQSPFQPDLRTGGLRSGPEAVVKGKRRAEHLLSL